MGWGGIQTHFEWLAQALAEKGHRVLILSVGGVPAERDRQRAGRCQETGDVTVRFLSKGTSWWSRWRMSWEIVQAIRRFDADCYVACGTGWNLFAPAVLGRGRTKRIFHEVMSGEVVRWQDSRWLAAHAFDGIVAQAAPVAVNFQRHLGWKGEIPVLPAFPEPLEKGGCLPVAQGHAVERGTIRAAYFGRLVPHKQAYWLVQQWPLLEGLIGELHIYGKGEEESAIDHYIAGHGLQKRIVRHGEYPTGQPYIDLLTNLDLVLLPTVGSEGAPLILLEAMSCGVPFVAYGTGGITDYANPDCQMPSPHEEGSFVRAIRTMTDDLAAGRIDHARLQRHYLENFSFQKIQEKWLRYFQSLTGRKA